jgi:hypothetical protein
MTEQTPGRFIETAMWKQLAQSLYSGDLSAEQKAAKTLDAQDLQALLKKVESGSANEQFAALGMFLHAVRSGNPAVEPRRAELVERATALAAKWKLQGRLPSPDVPARAYYLLAAIDKERATLFLIAHFDYGKLSTPERESVIHHLAELCHVSKGAEHNETAMARIVEIAQEGAPGAKMAVALLVGRQLMRRSQVQKLTQHWEKPVPSYTLPPNAIEEFLALSPEFESREKELTEHVREWLTTKSIASLNRVYNFISSLPEGAPVAPILAILGTPTSQHPERNPQTYVFSSDEGHQLQVHITSDRKVSAFKLK